MGRPVGFYSAPILRANVGARLAPSVNESRMLAGSSTRNRRTDSAVAVGFQPITTNERTPDNTGIPVAIGGLRHAVAVGFELVLGSSLTCGDAGCVLELQQFHLAPVGPTSRQITRKCGQNVGTDRARSPTECRPRRPTVRVARDRPASPDTPPASPPVTRHARAPESHTVADSETQSCPRGRTRSASRTSPRNPQDDGPPLHSTS